MRVVSTQYKNTLIRLLVLLYQKILFPYFVIQTDTNIDTTLTNGWEQENNI